MNKKAFTLIELLVVVAIIGLILAILMPALRSVREGGKQAFCANNLRQIGLALLMYADDHDDFMPSDGNQQDGSVKPWFWLIGKYLDIDDSMLNNGTEEGKDVLLCPSTPKNVNYVFPEYVGCQYAYNVNVAGGAWMVWPPVWTRLSKIVSPSETVMVCDGSVQNMGGDEYIYSISFDRDWVGYWHLGGANFLAVDGSVKKYTRDNVLDHLKWGID